VLESFLQSQRRGKKKDMKPFFFKDASTSRYISKMKFYSSFIDVKTLEKIPPCPFFPQQRKTHCASGEGLCFGGRFQIPFLSGGRG